MMTKSKICPLSTMSREELIQAGEDPDDPAGYFIVNGTERILVLVEEIAPNRVITAKVESGNITEVARIHSEKDGYIQRHLLERKLDGIITISFANVSKLPVAILIKALGLENDRDIAIAIGRAGPKDPPENITLIVSGIAPFCNANAVSFVP